LLLLLLLLLLFFFFFFFFFLAKSYVCLAYIEVPHNTMDAYSMHNAVVHLKWPVINVLAPLDSYKKGISMNFLFLHSMTQIKTRFPHNNISHSSSSVHHKSFTNKS
jgi:hypothetical protein